MYKVSCKDCDQKYIGQRQRTIKTRFKQNTWTTLNTVEFENIALSNALSKINIK